MTKLQHLLQHLHHLTSIVIPHSPLHTTSITAPLSTITTRTNNTPQLYELGPLISACSIFFCHFVIKTGSLTGCSSSRDDNDTNGMMEEIVLRSLVAVLLGWMAYVGMPYDIICSLELWSHVLPWVFGRCCVWSGSIKKKKQDDVINAPPSLLSSMALALIIMSSYPICLFTCRILSTPYFYTQFLPSIIPIKLQSILQYMFPISEMTASYNIILTFYNNTEQKKVLHNMLRHLLFVTAHIQFGLGHIGIDFLMSEQKRKNMLIRMDLDEKNPMDDVEDEKRKDNSGLEKNINKNSNNNNTDNRKNSNNKTTKNNKQKPFDPSRKFRKSAPTFILFTVLPYMFQIILFGNMNNFAFMYVRNQIHHSVRIDELFRHVSLLMLVMLLCVW
jgi:hypothetical protein